MKARTLSTLVVGLALVGCEQQSQELPFSADAVQPTVKTVSRTDSTVLSSSAGASVQFPAGSVSGSTSVTLTPVAAPAAAQGSGAAASVGYKLEPTGLVLEKPAGVELKFTENNRQKAWLASVVNVVGSEVRELPNTRVDLNSGLAQTKIGQLGTMTVVLPEPQAVFMIERAKRSGSVEPTAEAAVEKGTDSLALHCGGRGNRCAGLTVAATDNLINQVRNAAALFPQASGTLRINGTRATGRVELGTSIRVQLQSGATAENVEFNAVVEPTNATVVTESATSIRLSRVRFRIRGGGEGAEVRDYIDDLVIPKTSKDGLINISRTFQLRNKAGNLEDASVTVTLPAKIYR